MGLYIVEYDYKKKLQSVIEMFRPAHRTFMRDLHQRGILLSSGFLRDATTEGALLLMRCDSAQQVRDLLEEDPFNVNGLITPKTIKEWEPTIGERAHDFDKSFPIS